MQTYTIIENYTIIKKQSKSNFKFNKLLKLLLIAIAIAKYNTN